MAEEAGRRVALPRLRAAWLRELGVEVLWPVGVRSLPQPARQAEPIEQGPSEADEALSLVATVASAPLPSLPASGPVLEHAVPHARDQEADVPAEGTGAASSGRPAMLQCRLYADETSSGQARWLVVTDANELHPSRQGPTRFLDALVRAVLPGGRASGASLPVPQSEAVGWLAADDAFARLVAPDTRTRLVLIGIAARRAAGMSTRLGEIGRLQVGGAQLPAVALPLPSDLTASPTGKADAWRVLRALDSAEP